MEWVILFAIIGAGILGIFSKLNALKESLRQLHSSLLGLEESVRQLRSATNISASARPTAESLQQEEVRASETPTEAQAARTWDAEPGWGVEAPREAWPASPNAAAQPAVIRENFPQEKSEPFAQEDTASLTEAAQAELVEQEHVATTEWEVVAPLEWDPERGLRGGATQEAPEVSTVSEEEVSTPSDAWKEDFAAAAEAATEPAAEAAAELPGFVQYVRDFIKGGNLWAAGGVLMLLLGFAFLLTYMAEKGLFSVELRIALAALVGMGMVALGLRQRERRPMYALILQGGGIGVLYLCAFAAAKISTLLPPAVALGLMTLLIIPAVALALLQNAQVLALFGFFGGFAAPVLLSDGSGNHVALFTYYTLLNLGLLFIARFRLWRWLNLLGAGCTFVVMGYWGITAYTVDKFATVEPFLLAYVLIFIGITLLSVHRREFSFSCVPDAALALSIPFLAALSQWRLAADVPHGLSLSAVAFGAFFILLAAWVWRRWGEDMRRLAEFYLASGIMLANMAIPLEISGKLTASVWAVEGALFFFFACRQKSWRLKIVGLILQAVSVPFFFWDLAKGAEHTLVSSGLIALAALASAVWQKQGAAEEEKPDLFREVFGDLPLERLLALVGGLWWFAGLALEVSRHAEQPLAVFFGAVSLSSLVLYAVGRRLDFAEFRLAAALPLPLAFLSLGVGLVGDVHRWDQPTRLLTHNFFAGREGLAWLAFAVGQGAMLWLGRAAHAAKVHAAWTGIVIVGLLLAVSSSGRGLMAELGLARAWISFAGVFPSFAYILAIIHLSGKSLLGREHVRVLLGYIPALLFAPLALWFGRSLFAEGSPRPLPFYLPVLNPLELKQALCIAVFGLWQTVLRRQEVTVLALPLPRLIRVLDILAFAWLHSMLFRSVHFFAGVPMSAAWHHGALQTLLTILWGLWGTMHIIIGNKKRVRPLWLMGAALICADTAKLFLLDFADKDTLFRIISFFAVGGLFLLIGWLAPLPPSAKADTQAEDDPAHASGNEEHPHE